MPASWSNGSPSPNELNRESGLNASGANNLATNTMKHALEEIKQVTKNYILQEFLPGEEPQNLTEAMPLITGGILDSISTVKLVSFLEESFGVTFQAHEMGVEHLDSLQLVAQTVQTKLAKKP